MSADDPDDALSLMLKSTPKKVQPKFSPSREKTFYYQRVTAYQRIVNPVRLVRLSGGIARRSE
jgi:hypothetical protein